MKTYRFLTIIVVAAFTILATACKKENALVNLTSDITGKYVGTLTAGNLKVLSNATVDVTQNGENQIEIHCYGDEIDTTFTQRLFEDGEMIQMCFSGDDFYNEYNHEMTNQSEHHNMMKDSEGLSWMHHLDEEHDSGDLHYGSFDTSNNSFNYTFKSNGGILYNYKFKGTKQ